MQVLRNAASRLRADKERAEARSTVDQRIQLNASKIARTRDLRKEVGGRGRGGKGKEGGGEERGDSQQLPPFPRSQAGIAWGSVLQLLPETDPIIWCMLDRVVMPGSLVCAGGSHAGGHDLGADEAAAGRGAAQG